MLFAFSLHIVEILAGMLCLSSPLILVGIVIWVRRYLRKQPDAQTDSPPTLRHAAVKLAKKYLFGFFR